MDNQKTINILVLVGSTFLGAIGQLLFKIGVTSYSYYEYVFLAAGLAVYGIATLSYFYVIGRSYLSWAYGFTGLSYVFASFMAFIFLSEQIPLLRWAGIGVITIGTVLIGLS